LKNYIIYIFLLFYFLKVPYLHVEDGGLEIDQDELWDTFVNVVKEVISSI